MGPSVTSMNGQRKIIGISLCLAVAIAISSYMIGRPDEGLGVLFGTSLMAINLLIMSQITKLCEFTKFVAIPDCAKMVAFGVYQMRFFLFVFILYQVITKAGFLFAIGTFIGFLIPKVPMGFVIAASTGEDWWLHKTSVETSSRPEKLPSSLEREFVKNNPFQLDNVEWEMKKTISKV